MRTTTIIRMVVIVSSKIYLGELPSYMWVQNHDVESLGFYLAVPCHPQPRLLHEQLWDDGIDRIKREIPRLNDPMLLLGVPRRALEPHPRDRHWRPLSPH